jgi:hypothetical protein
MEPQQALLDYEGIRIQTIFCSKKKAPPNPSQAAKGT